MTTDRARIGGGKRGEKENKAPAPKRTVTPGYTPQSGPTLPIPLTPHRVKETGFTPSFFFVPLFLLLVFVCSRRQRDTEPSWLRSKLLHRTIRRLIDVELFLCFFG